MSDLRKALESVDCGWKIDILTIHFLPPQVIDKFEQAVTAWHTAEIKRIIGPEPEEYNRHKLWIDQRKRAGLDTLPEGGKDEA